MTAEELKEKLGWLKTSMGPRNVERLSADVDALVADVRRQNSELLVELAEASRDLLGTDESLPSYKEVLLRLETVVTKCEKTGIIDPQD